MAKKNKVVAFLKKPFFKTTILCLLLALLFTVLNHFAIYFPWILHEQDIIPESTEYKMKANENDREENAINRDRIARDFLLIDVSNDLDRYCDTERADQAGLPVDPGSVIPSPCNAGIDLRKLTNLFKWLSEHQDQYNLIVCDMILDRLDTSTLADSLLGYIIEIAHGDAPCKILFSSIYNKKEGKFNSSTVSINLPVECKGAVNEELTDYLFFKYKLSYNNGKIKSLPLLMLEKINKYEIEPGLLGLDTYKKPDGRTLTADNLFIPEMLFSNKDFDLLKTPGNYNGATVDSSVGKMELWQTLLKFDDSNNYYLQQVLKTSSEKKRNIFIGSFNHTNPDVHKTLYGDMDGGIILLNIYYNLVINGNRLDWGYNFFILLCFFPISFLVLKHPHNPWRVKFVPLRAFLDFVVEELHYIILVAMTILSSVIFDKASNVIVLSVFIFIAGKIIKASKEIKAEKHANKKPPLKEEPGLA